MDFKTETYRLQYPITHNAALHTTITLREPDVDALEVIDELGLSVGETPRIRHVRAMIVALGDLPDEAVGKMHRDDLTALGELLGPLLDPAAEAAVQ